MTNFVELLERSLPLLVKGLGMTLQVLLGSALLSFSVGLLFGILSCNRLKKRWLTPFIEGTTFVFRAVPFYIWLLIVYFVLPDLGGFTLEPFTAAVWALGMCSSGYVAQIVRAGINSIPLAQWEAAFTLRYSTMQSLRYVILPQMFRNVLPAFTNELDSLLKSTAIASTIGMLELTRMGMNIVSREMEPVPIYLTIAFFYLCMSAILNLVMRRIEYAKR
ncbi:MAG: amino acid ABC transporter permease [Verrucomicrobia bacterium]|nr:amino acid ABC transporter permease [Verrucomicrobiota bacterium]